MGKILSHPRGEYEYIDVIVEGILKDRGRSSWWRRSSLEVQFGFIPRWWFQLIKRCRSKSEKKIIFKGIFCFCRCQSCSLTFQIPVHLLEKSFEEDNKHWVIRNKCLCNWRNSIIQPRLSNRGMIGGRNPSILWQMLATPNHLLILWFSMWCRLIS
ncbi:unnamed protein product [Vicia faba]|uniref:Uncharacterized protein n=1 Tax=Vicia faba TaxID=3906 RepID=A0AAV1B7Y5_VICFA|nr:unnamed protein product [Vicia faba]